MSGDARRLAIAAGLWSLTGCGGAPLDAVGLPPRDLAEGLVAHFAFDEGAGAIAKDTSGNGRDGQLTSGTWIADAHFAGGLRLERGDSVTIPSFPAATPSFTMATWVRLSADQLAMDDGTWVAIAGTEIFRAGGWQLNIDRRLSQPRFDFAYWSAPLMDYLFVECECVETGRWIHLAAVVDVDANLVTLYKDGSIGDQETRPSDISPGDSTLYVGRWNMNGRLLSGDLDDLAIWNRALSADEIAELVARALPPAAGMP